MFERVPVPTEEPLPAYFADLNLDRVYAAMNSRHREDDLSPFLAPLQDPVAVRYRQDAVADLRSDRLMGAVRAFTEQMHVVRRRLQASAKRRFPREQDRWFLDATADYADAVSSLAQELASIGPRSEAFAGLGAYLDDYVNSEGFRSLSTDAQRLQRDLAGVRFCIDLKGTRVRVSRYRDESDYSSEIEATFARFEQGETQDYRVRFPPLSGLDHVGAKILEIVAGFYPEVFAELEAYRIRYEGFLDPGVTRFDADVRFYLAFLDHIAPLEAAGLPFCFPQVSATAKQVIFEGSFDLALASTLEAGPSGIVGNDLALSEPERMIVITGPNQGGKTTFARMFGQLHHLGALGLPVPGRTARLFLPDRIFTHFEREEDIRNLRGKLEDDLVRLREITGAASPSSIVILNEIFASTSLRDAIVVGTAVLRRIIDLDVLCVCVTFVDELASMGPTVVSLVSTVVPDDPATRTFEILRRPADGLAYAAAIAAKHGLTEAAIKERLEHR